MARLLYLLPLLFFSCLLAAIYGAVHNQISYTVAPGYFHEFKFRQFVIDPALQGRAGASLVGALASWWMGLLLGVPIYLAGLFIRDTGTFWRCYIKASVIVVAVTLLAGLGALGYAWVTFTPDSLPPWMEGRPVSDPVSDPVAFARAGFMHNFSYLGGVIGAGVGLGYMIAAAFISWQR